MGRWDMTWRMIYPLFVIVLLGCSQVPVERFDQLSLGLTAREVKGLLGKPHLRYERMWEYRLVGGEHGFVAFDRRGRLSAWLREEAPRLRGGLVPLTEETYERLRLGTEGEALLVLLGEPARREDGRWHYLAPGGYQLILEMSPEGLLLGKSWEQLPTEQGEEKPWEEPEKLTPTPAVELELPSPPTPPK